MSKVQRIAQCIRLKLSRLKLSARFENVVSLKTLHSLLPRLMFTRVPEGIGGWMSFDEQRALYALARYSRGPLLEIGPWLGISTICIARGILDSGVSKEFLTCELAPTLDNFRAVDDHLVGFFYPKESEAAMGVGSLEIFERDIKPVLEHPEGLLGQLRSNLANMKVADIVSIFVGDFRSSPARRYQFVFSDAMHDENEINRNAPDLRRFVSEGTILACHDSNEENEKCLRNYFKFGYSFTVGSLFVGEVIN